MTTQPMILASLASAQIQVSIRIIVVIMIVTVTLSSGLSDMHTDNPAILTLDASQSRLQNRAESHEVTARERYAQIQRWPAA